MKPIALEPRKVETLVIACVTLHNFIRTKTSSRALYSQIGSFDHENTAAGTFRDGNWRPRPLTPGVQPKETEPLELTDIDTSQRGRQLETGKDIMNHLCEYFNSEAGEVPRQRKMLQLGIEWK